MSASISVQDLRVGLFIHLDVGWMSHPFPLSSFKITDPEQIETIQSLGLSQVRWSPERSDPPLAAEAPVTVPASPVVEDAAARGRREAAERLAEQQAAQRLCERQHAEASRELRRLTERVPNEPEAAREGARDLTRALLHKMLADGDICVRVLGELQGDRATAHAMNVTVISLLLARAQGLSSEELLDLGTGALLHDVGKLELPDRVRLPRDDYSAPEQALYRDHVVQGINQGRRMGLSPAALLVLAQHHEHADGSGFPQAVKLERMTMLARVVGLVNHYDNLCNAAVPARSLTPHEALSRMFAQGRARFDPQLLSAFIRLMGIYPPGTLVQLTDDRHAMVMAVNSARPLKPLVLVCDSKVQAGQALHLDLDGVPDLGIRRSLRAEQLPAKAADYLAPRHRVAYFFDVAPHREAADDASRPVQAA